MTIIRFGPLLALGGAACLIAWTPEGRMVPEGAAEFGGFGIDVGLTHELGIGRHVRKAAAASCSGARPVPR